MMEMSEEKWTKEQIETAKKIYKSGCLGIKCDECPICVRICSASGESLNQLIQQHEHDADEPEKAEKLSTNDVHESWLKPIPIPDNSCNHDYWRYMFAGMAMQGLLSGEMETEDTIAENAITYADALIKKLEGKDAGK